MRHLRIARGDITRWPSVDAIVTSANAGLVGNKTPSYWRFRVPRARSGHTRSDVGFEGLGGMAFDNCDASVHAASGPELQAALDAQPRHTRLRQSLSASEPWRGSLLPSSSDGLVACLVGRSVVTPAFGALRDAIYANSIVRKRLLGKGMTALTQALKNFKGAVVTVSHNEVWAVHGLQCIEYERA